MISWINANSNLLLVLLTAVYVVATVAVWRVMIESNKLSQVSIEQIRNLEMERLRPYLSLELKIIKSDGKDGLPYGYLLLKNTGLTQARHVSIDMNPVIFSTPLIDGVKQKKIPYFVGSTTYTVPPNTELSDSIGFLPGVFDNSEIPIFKGVIKYTDANNKNYQDPYTIDLDAMRLATPYIR